MSLVSEAACWLIVSIVSSYRIDTKKDGSIVVYANDKINPNTYHWRINMFFDNEPLFWTTLSGKDSWSNGPSVSSKSENLIKYFLLLH